MTARKTDPEADVKAQLAEAVEQEPPRLVVVVIDGDQLRVDTQGVDNFAAPAYLRRAAKVVEERLGI
jgi:hypothetical protein